MTNDDAPSAEHEALLQFLYQLPAAVVRFGNDGAIDLMNPRAASLLNRVAPAPTTFDFFGYFDRFAPELRARIAEALPSSGTIIDRARIFTGGTPASASEAHPVLALTIVRTDADFLTAMFDDVTHEVEVENERDRQREIIRSMTTPIIEGWHGTLVLPILGIVDAERAEAMTRDLLEGVVRRAARVVILDFTGIAEVHDGWLEQLRQTTGALVLVGCRCIVTGISPELASRLTELDQPLRGVETLRTVREAIVAVAAGGASAHDRRHARQLR